MAETSSASLAGLGGMENKYRFGDERWEEQGFSDYEFCENGALK